MNHHRRAISGSTFFRALWIMTEAVLLLLILLVVHGRAQQFENRKLLASDGADHDDFATSVAIFEDRILIGAPHDDDNGNASGSAYVYRYDSLTGTWQEEAKLLASDGADVDRFGYAVALTSDRALVGAAHDDDNGDASGSAYLFRYDSVSGTWQEEAKLLASDGSTEDYFGCAVALSGETALIGASGHFHGRGAAYVYRYDSASGTWQEEAKLLASEAGTNEYFGSSVALSGERALIGSHGDDNFKGSAFVFRYDSVSGTWQEEAKLVASDGPAQRKFGNSVSLCGTTALVGAHSDKDNGIAAGAAYLFDYNDSSGTWEETAKLLASDGEAYERFGCAVGVFGQKALIGKWGDETYGAGTGSAYVFGYDPFSKTWHEEAKLLASDGENGDYLGRSAALFGDKALVGADSDSNINGANAGGAYVYDFNSTLALDVKCNGQDQNVIVDVSENVTLTIDIDNGYHPDLKGDFWVVAILPISGWNTWTYGPWMNPIWRYGAGNEYFTGPPLNHAATVCDQPLPPGNYKLYLAMDAIPNGVLNLTALWDFDVVDFTVQ